MCNYRGVDEYPLRNYATEVVEEADEPIRGQIVRLAARVSRIEARMAHLEARIVALRRLTCFTWALIFLSLAYALFSRKS